MYQHGKKKTNKNLLDFCTLQKIEIFFSYFMRLFNSCVVQQDSVLQAGVKQNF